MRLPVGIAGFCLTFVLFSSADACWWRPWCCCHHGGRTVSNVMQSATVAGVANVNVAAMPTFTTMSFVPVQAAQFHAVQFQAVQNTSAADQSNLSAADISEARAQGLNDALTLFLPLIVRLLDARLGQTPLLPNPKAEPDCSAKANGVVPKTPIGGPFGPSGAAEAPDATQGAEQKDAAQKGDKTSLWGPNRAGSFRFASSIVERAERQASFQENLRRLADLSEELK